MTLARVRHAFVGVALAALVLLAGCRADGIRSSDVFPIPDSTTPEPRLLADGTPVLVVAKHGHLPVVVEAISTHAAWGVAKLVRWCPGSNTLVDVHGSRWDTFGAKRGGPAPSGLATFNVTRIANSGNLRVGARLPGAPLGTRTIPETPKSGKHCEFEDAKALVDVSGTRRVDTPAELRVNEWDRVTGVLITRSGRPTRLCPESTAAMPPPCAGGLDAPGLEQPPDGWWSRTAWLVRRRGNVVDRIL